MAGYHLYEIPKGKLGEYSKVVEEFMEFSEALEQDCQIMAILELADLIGSAKYYYYQYEQEAAWQLLISRLLIKKTLLPIDYSDLLENFQRTLNQEDSGHWDKLGSFIEEIDLYVRKFNLTIRDLICMSHVTERAFINGYRT